MASRKRSEETMRRPGILRTMEFMMASEVGGIFSAFEKVFQDRAFQRGKLSRPAPPRTWNIDTDIVRNAAIFDEQHTIGHSDRFSHVMRHQDRRERLIVPDTFEQP